MHRLAVGGLRQQAALDDAESLGGGQSKREHPSPSSPLSPPKRSRRSVERRVVSVPIAECGERAKTNGEGPPPSSTPQAQVRLGAAGHGEARPGRGKSTGAAWHVRRRST
uniref:Uncharacterized protein n=1 Tax=Triticum urartu TaxID=4572 RepID=A0A8R7PWP7_TRIUA